jgi:drug/metabolite transporter (DMT)-like permease
VRNRAAFTAIFVACVIWGTTVALSKVALTWLDPSWLAVLRFGLAVPLLALVARHELRAALTPRVIAAGALGYGVSMLLQNEGVEHTSVAHAAIIVGALPAVIAVLSVVLRRGRPTRLAWVGYVIGGLGIALVAGGKGGGAASGGDLLMLVSVVGTGFFMMMQPAVLRGRNVTAVTAVEFLAGALTSLPFALLGHGAPEVPTHAGPVVAFVVLALVCTALPFWLFAYGQARVAPELAGGLVNIEPLVGAMLGWVAFSDPAGVAQLLGASVVVVGIVLSTVSGETLLAWWESGVAHLRPRAAISPHGTSRPEAAVAQAAADYVSDRYPVQSPGHATAELPVSVSRTALKVG